MAYFRVCALVVFGILSGWPASSLADSLAPNLVRVYVLLEVNGKPVTQETGSAYTVVATREDGTHFEPAVVDSLVHPVGGNSCYAELDIPIHRPRDPTGVLPGDVVRFHVYWAGSKLLLNEPENGYWTVPGDAQGDTRALNILALSGPSAPVCITQSEVDQQIADAIAQWDAGGDGRVGLEEAVRALQVVCGLR
jgi:hypothetical protein